MGQGGYAPTSDYNQASFIASGLGTGAKAVGNAAVETVTSTATLGYYEATGVFGGQDEHGYALAHGFTRTGTEILAGVATGGLGHAGKVGKVIALMDVASNVTNVGRGIDNMTQNGVTWQNGLQVVGGVAGLGGNYAGAAESVASPYAGIRQASQYLQELGVSRAQRVQILQSFEAGTVNMRAAGSSEFGLRFFDGVNAQARGRFLFETFPASRESLALSSRWNQMTSFTQWQIREGSMLIEGRAAAQGAGLPGGQIQKFVPNLDNLFK